MEESEVPAAAGAPGLPAPYAELRDQLVRAIRRVCPPWLAQDVDDLVQDAMIRLIQRQERAQQHTALSPAYLKKVAYSTVVDEIRRRQRRPEQAPGDDDTDLMVDEASGSGEALIGRAIEECMARQNPDRRRALTLHLLGHSVMETARILDCNVKRAENLVYRGLAQLRGCLKQRGVTP